MCASLIIIRLKIGPPQRRWASSACQQAQRLHEHLCSDDETTTESRGSGEETTKAPTRHAGVHAYCGALSYARQGALWVLQLGLRVGARLGTAMDEVVQQ